MVISKQCTTLKKNDFGIYCKTCDTYWVHGICNCESILRIGCNCEECEKPAPMPIKGMFNKMFVKGIELPDGKWVVEVTNYHKRLLGFIGRKKPPAILRVVGYEYSWRYLSTMSHTGDKLRIMLEKIYEKLRSGKL